ncbi:MAG: 2-oxoglutarate dehydrogenase, E2 component, dihydrolipoamide succinyltransferase, partial [Actinobacteria bacterium]|nr:2-oxoglutarate dehydrogenase, E2 component, dihydrolipoamide succinyltransferase [Actinomycetota bacterium]
MAAGTAVDVVMPQMGVSVSEGTITKWLKQPGEEIAADEPLLEISTDKVDTEVPSPAAGVVREILSAEGETVAVGTKIAVIAPEGDDGTAPETPAEPATAQAAAEANEAGDAPTASPSAETVDEVEAAPEGETAPTTTPESGAKADAESDVDVDGDGDGRGEAKFVSPVVG